ncbi:MAG: hypothetical protein IPN94_08615 [Sphingobacteriales bacterium]|nr:hypothetical protein [Sphingobacteriales bacterium]
MHIANPIYDVVFKYLMDDSKIAKLIISTITTERLIYTLSLLPLTKAKKKLKTTNQKENPTPYHINDARFSQKPAQHRPQRSPARPPRPTNRHRDPPHPKANPPAHPPPPATKTRDPPPPPRRKETDFPEKYRLIIRKLQKAIENAEVKQKMDMEDSLLDELTEMERLIDNLGEENVQKIHKIEELEKREKTGGKREKTGGKREKTGGKGKRGAKKRISCPA